MVDALYRTCVGLKLFFGSPLISAEFSTIGRGIWAREVAFGGLLLAWMVLL